jgi:hypothetical protein
MIHSTDTVGKIIGATTVGVTVSMADVEMTMRIISLSLGITLSIVAFIRNERKLNRNRKDEKELD